ncbi:MAG: Gfo/Idh/MocA family oxidoreductase [Clostridiaceae bacterium]|nr:Gfo/Idh/MocA family oxidoreductase [Clostridiaceae bacterium]
MKTIKWGIIGCGDVTEVKSGPGFQKAINSELVAVMRRNGELAKDYAQRHNVAKWYDDAEKLINDPEVDAVYIATPPVFHKEYTLKCALAGKPVYVEKPMAMSYEEAEEMVEACKNKGVPLFTAYYRRRLPAFLKVKELVESGAIGEVRFVKVTLYKPPTEEEMNAEALPWRVVPEISGGGIFLDLASHTIDVLEFILGPIKDAMGHASNQAGLYSAEDMVSANFYFESGAHGIGAWCFSAFEAYDRNEIIGTKGKIIFSTFGLEPVELANSQGTVLFPINNPQHVHQPLIQTIVNELNGEGKCPSTGESGSRVNLIMDKILGRIK